LFADKCHHGKEEGILFPEMETAGIPKENGPIGQMLAEHAEGRKFIAQMSDALLKNFQANEFIGPAMNYINLLRSHIEKENKILFPLGDVKIPMIKQKELIKLFEEHEEKVMGTGTHEKLHEILHKFERIYLLGG
jgi:hemerythrin-like domain-containing protein